MKLINIIEKEYTGVSKTVVNSIVSPKKDEKLEYALMPLQNTYAKGVHTLRNSYVRKEEVPSQLWYKSNGQKLVRPLSFRENLLARVDNFETLKNKDGSVRTMEERLKFFNMWFDSCTGLAYSSQNENDFMIISICEELIIMPENFRKEYLLIDYTHFQSKGFSLKRSQAKYCQALTHSEVITHPAWIASVEEDIGLLCTYASIVFDQTNERRNESMSFYLKDKMEKDQLRGMFVSNLDDSSFASASNYFYVDSSFLRAAPLS